MNQKNLELLEQELRRDEGVRHRMYEDTMGVETIGIGHNCRVAPLPDDWTQPITDGQIQTLYEHDRLLTFAELNLHLPWWVNLDDVRRRVLANMTFNMGIYKVLDFRLMIRALLKKDWEAAAFEMIHSIWADQVGERAQRLAKMMRTGEA